MAPGSVAITYQQLLRGTLQSVAHTLAVAQLMQLSLSLTGMRRGMESLLHNSPSTEKNYRRNNGLGLCGAKELSPLSNKQLGLTDRAVNSPASKSGVLKDKASKGARHRGSKGA